MKNPAPGIIVLIAAVTLALSSQSASAQTCQEKRDTCVAQCDKILDAAKKAICVQKCDDQLEECKKKNRPRPLDLSNEVALDVCLEGGAPCRQPVRKICTLMAGACNDCWKTLCGGNWSFGSDRALQVKLLAATGPAKNGRLLATSSMKGKQAALRVPAQIKLNSNEQLYFEFSSKEKPRGSAKVRIRQEK